MADGEPAEEGESTFEAVMGDSSAASRLWGLRDEDFEQRRPLRGQITKREVRAFSLYCLGLRKNSIVWDIGAGTGSISVEAGFIAQRGRVFAIERDEDSVPLLRKNVDRFGIGNIEVVTGSAPQALAALPDPHSVFLGGSGGNLPEILEECASRLRSDGRIVANFATLERTNETYQWFQNREFLAEISMINAARSRPMPDGSVRLEALNPVFIVCAWRQGPSSEDWVDER